MRSLKSRLILLTVSILVLGIGVHAIFVKSRLQADVEAQLTAQQFTAVSTLAAMIEREIQNRSSAIDRVARTINKAMLEDRAALQNMLEHRPVFQDLFNAGVIVTDIGGTAIADFPVTAGRVGTNYIDRDSVAEALRGNRFVGKPVVGKKLNVPVFGISAPIRDDANRIIGALVGITNLTKDSFLNVIENQPHGVSGSFMVASVLNRSIIAATDDMKVKEPIPSPGQSALIDRFFEGFEGAGLITQANGEPILMSSATVPTAKWLMIAALPASEGFAPVQRLGLVIALSSLTVVLFAGILIWWILERQLRPLSTAAAFLSGNTRRISEGLEHPSLPVERPDEVGMLLTALNTLMSVRAERDRELGQRRLQIENRIAVVNALADLSRQMIASEPRIETIAEHVLNSARALTKSAHGFVSEIDPETKKNVGYTLTEMMGNACRIEGANRKIEFSPAENGMYPQLWGHALNTKQGFYTNEPPSHPMSAGVPEGHVPLRAFLSMPVMLRGEVVGQIALANPDAPYDNGSLETASHLADLYALAIDRARNDRRRRIAEQHQLQSQKMEAIGLLAGGVAHDFNNILMAITGYMQLIRDDAGEGSEISDFAQRSLQAAFRARDIVAQLLAFSRSERGEKTGLSLAEIVKEVMALVRASIPRSIAIDLWFDSKLKPVSGISHQLHQIVLNLISNARDAIGEAGGRISIRIEDKTLGAPRNAVGAIIPPGHYACLVISDDGPGMDESLQAKAFLPFFTTKEVGRGTGLGLSVVHGIVKDHGGYITLNSRIGDGTAVGIYLPVLEEQGAVKAPQVEAEPPSVREDKVGKVLLVDDEEIVLEPLALNLKRMGYQVEAVSDPFEAVIRLSDSSREYDILVSDLVMPGLSGLDIAERAKAARPNLPIILCTGRPTEIGANEGDLVQRGIVDVLVKPVSLMKMSAVIKNCIMQANARA